MDLPERIETDAALWFARIEQGLSATEQDEFLEWLTADPRHGQELNRHMANWSRLDLLADWRPEHSPRPNPNLLAPPPVEWFRSHREWLVGASLAAAVTLGLFLALSRPPAESPRVTTPLIPSIERRTLEDGSTIQLNRGAQIVVFYSAGERRLRLDHGEATFTAAKNPNRPFIVSVAGIDLRAIGTAFNVRLASSSVDVVVTEGTVAVHSPDPTASDTPREPTYLRAGEMASIGIARRTAPEVTAVSPQRVEELLAWQPTWLDFNDASLASVVEEMQRRNAPIRILIADRELSSMIVNASLRSDNIENFIELLDRAFGVQADRNGNTLTLRKARDR